MKKTPFAQALDVAEPVVLAVRREQFTDPTPCADWDVHELLNHMYNELAWVPELLVGKTVEQVGDALDGDLVGEDHIASWRTYAEPARTSATQAAPHLVVHLSYGNVPANAYLDEMAGELIVHAWDLARGTGQTAFHIPEDLAEIVHAITLDKAAKWREMGLVGPEVKVAQDATAEAKLLGLLGRKLN